MKQIFQTHPNRLLLCLLFTIIGGGNFAWGETKATIKFGSGTGSTNVNDASITGKDSQENSWTITTVGTTSFTPNALYAQVGSSKQPATSITFTTTLSEDVNVTAFSAKFGGFSGTAGTVTLKVGDTAVGTGSLNASNDVTVSSTSNQTGKVLTVTVTGISKGVKCYNISYTYDEGGASLAESDFTLTGALNFDLYNNKSPQIINYTTSSTGAVTVSENDYVTTAVDEEAKTITVTPKAVTSGAQTITVNQAADETYAAGSASFTVTITDNTPAYTVTFSDGGSVTEASGHAGVTLPSRSDRGNYVFAGWSETNIAPETTEAPEIIPAGSYSPTSNITLYPVYKRIEAGGAIKQETASVTISDYATQQSWSNSQQYSSVVFDDITATAAGTTNTGKYYANGNDWRFYQNENATVTIATTSGELTSVTFEFTVSNTGALLYNSDTVTSGTSVSVSGTSAEFTVGNSGSATNGQVRITSISVNYSVQSSTTYYCSVPVITEPTIDVATTSIEAPAEGLSGTIDVTYENFDDIDADVYFCDAEGDKTTYDWILAVVNAQNNIEYVVDANTETTIRTAYMKVYALDDEANDVYSKLITITQAGRDFATLTPTFEYDGNGTGTLPTGLTASGLGTYGSSPKMQFNSTGDYLVLKIGEAPGTLSYDIKGNSFSGGIFKVQVSVDGETYKDLDVFVSLSGDTESKTYGDIDPEARYIRWYYTTKSSGNVALGNISLTAAGNTRPITVTSAGYATYCSNVALDFTNSDIKAYVGTRSGDKLTFTPITQVPAQTGLLLVCAGGTTADVPVIASAPEVENNCLTGVTVYKQLTVNDYILNVVEGEGAGFFKTGILHTKLKANRAYIPASKVAGVKSFAIDFDDDATSLNEELRTKNEESKGEAVLYNLAGQRLSKMQKGINIVNGKKILK